MMKPLKSILAAAVAVPLCMAPAIAGDGKALHAKLNQDKQARYEAREKLQNDKAAGNKGAIAADRAALEAAKAQVQADKQALQAYRDNKKK